MKRVRPLVSVIVPSMKDGATLKKNLSSLRRDPRIEVIVVEAEKVGISNRAAQMNRGAQKAHGNLLVFLHADTRIGSGDLLELHHEMRKDRSIIGGAFVFKLDQDHWKARLIEWGVLLREILFRLPYGDQCLFVRRPVFERIGGYPEAPLLEDVFLIQKIKSTGRFYFYPKIAVTSARRWERHGYLKTTFVNWVTMILWKTGISLESLKKIRERAFA